MQGKNTSDIKLNLPTCQGLEKCLGLGLSTSRSRSRLGPKIERLGLDLVKSGKVSVSVSSRIRSQTYRSRLGLGPQRLVYIPASALLNSQCTTPFPSVSPPVFFSLLFLPQTPVSLLVIWLPDTWLLACPVRTVPSYNLRLGDNNYN